MTSRRQVPCSGQSWRNGQNPFPSAIKDLYADAGYRSQAVESPMSAEGYIPHDGKRRTREAKERHKSPSKKLRS